MAKSASKEKKIPNVLFARVGWMRFYAGSVPGDERPVGGGQWTADNVGVEVSNFRDVGGRLYGYFQPAGPAQTLNLKRIDPAAEDATELRGVLVVMVATRPGEGGQVILGWYKDAVVTRSVVRPPPGTPPGHNYFCSAQRENCVLLPTDDRRFLLPKGKGGFGRANVCYALKPDGNPKDAQWIQSAVNYIEGYRGYNILDDPATDAARESADAVEKALARSQGQGFAHNATERGAIEARAMTLATRYFRGEGYAVENMSATQPFDLRCRRQGQELHVEVKGTTTDGTTIVLTRGEVLHANNSAHAGALFVVYSMRLTNGRALGGETLVINPWRPQAPLLTPVSYAYRLDH